MAPFTLVVPGRTKYNTAAARAHDFCVAPHETVFFLYAGEMVLTLPVPKGQASWAQLSAPLALVTYISPNFPAFFFLRCHIYFNYCLGPCWLFSLVSFFTEEVTNSLFLAVAPKYLSVTSDSSTTTCMAVDVRTITASGVV